LVHFDVHRYTLSSFPVRLRYKLLALAAPGLGLVIIGALAFAMVVERSVERQEQELWDSRVSRAKNEIEHVAENLKGLVKDYAFWDEIIIFADRPSDLWARDELLWLEQFQGIDFLLVFDRSGAIVYASELAKSVNAAESLEASFGALRELALARPGETALWAPQGERGVWLVAGTLHTSTARAFEPPGEGVLVIGYDVSPTISWRNLAADSEALSSSSRENPLPLSHWTGLGGRPSPSLPASASPPQPASSSWRARPYPVPRYRRSGD